MRFVAYTDSGVSSRRIKELISHAVGNPAEQRLDGILNETYARPDSRLYVLIDGTRAVGVIGVKSQGPSAAEILHIAVEETLRGQGIGRKLVCELLSCEGIDNLTAETDRDAVNFYRSCGFAVQSLGEKYPGVERFHCVFRSGF